MSKRRRYGAEEIIARLREAAVHLAQGQTVGQTARQLGISEQTYYRWRREYGGMRVDQAKRLKGAGARSRAAQAPGRRPAARQLDPARGGPGQLLSPAKRRRAVAHVRAAQQVSERRACRVIGQARATQRYVPRESPNERALVARLVALASRFGRYGYRRVTALLRQEGWRVNHKRVERLWRQKGLKVPAKQPKRGRLWLADGSIVRRRAEHRDHVWAYDFVFDRTADGRKLRLLTIVDEYTRECLAVDVARRLNSQDVLARLAELFVRRGVPVHIRSDNGPEFTAALRQPPSIDRTVGDRRLRAPTAAHYAHSFSISPLSSIAVRRFSSSSGATPCVLSTSVCAGAFTTFTSTTSFSSRFGGRQQQLPRRHRLTRHAGILADACGKSLSLSGTLMGGYSSTLFHLLYRFSPEIRTEFGRAEEGRWIERYGFVEHTIGRDDGDSLEDGRTSRRRKYRKVIRVRPGRAPAALFHLIGNSVFLRLSDVAAGSRPTRSACCSPRWTRKPMQRGSRSGAATTRSSGRCGRRSRTRF